MCAAILPSEPTTAKPSLHGWTLVAILVGLVMYPILYSSGIMGRFWYEVVRLNNREWWWYFHLSLLVFHWIPFVFIWIALRRSREGWHTIGLDWGWFARRRYLLAGLLVLLLVACFAAPRMHYAGGRLPLLNETVWLGPVSASERLMIILTSLTAGITEEVIFRGFGITRLTRLVRSPWIAMILTTISFIYIHGTRSPIPYAIAGLAFGVPFVLMRCRRLEILILIHFLIDAGMVLSK